MKTLVIYYSLSGHTRALADSIARKVSADKIELEAINDAKSKKGFAKYFWGGKQVLFNEKPELKPFELDISKYDMILMGTPIWAGGFNPVFKTLFSKYDFSGKKLAVFASHESELGNLREKVTKAIPNTEIVDVVGFRNARDDVKAKEVNSNKASEWAMKISDSLTQ